MDLKAVWHRLAREAVVRASSMLPEPRRRAIERRWRGREEAHYLRNADCVVVSCGKSGRTWLRVMLSRFFQIRYDLPAHSLLGFDNLHRRNRAVPKIFFTHDNYLRDYTGNPESKTDFSGRKVVLLVRHPADTAVSQYFQWRYRMAANKKWLNGYPPHGADVSVFDFVMDEAGLSKIVGFMNGWARALPELESVLTVRYEDMRGAPDTELRRVLSFMGADPSAEEIAEAVEFASVDRMRELETRRVFRRSGSRMRAKDKGNPDSYKVRRAKVGGYRDYFDDDQLRRIDDYLRAHLDPVFGYTHEDRDAPAKDLAGTLPAGGAA